MKVEVGENGCIVDGQPAPGRLFRVINLETGLEIPKCVYANEATGCADHFVTDENGKYVFKNGAVLLNRVLARLRIEEVFPADEPIIVEGGWFTTDKDFKR